MPSPGRRLLEAKQKGDFDSNEPLEIPDECPHCGHSNLITGAEIKSTLRHFETSINKLSQLIQLKSQHCYCQTCGQAFCVCGRDVPVKPGREMGQSVVVAAAELNAVGIPLNKVMQLLFMKDDQLGKDTLGRNLHDWLVDTGKPLLDAVLAELNTQHTMVMGKEYVKHRKAKIAARKTTSASSAQRPAPIVSASVTSISAAATTRAFLPRCKMHVPPYW